MQCHDLRAMHQASRHGWKRSNSRKISQSFKSPNEANQETQKNMEMRMINRQTGKKRRGMCSRRICTNCVKPIWKNHLIAQLQLDRRLSTVV